MDIQETPQVSFAEEGAPSAVPQMNSIPQSRLVQLIIDNSGGMVKDATGATYVLLGIVGIAFAFALYLIITATRPLPPPPPTEEIAILNTFTS